MKQKSYLNPLNESCMRGMSGNAKFAKRKATLVAIKLNFIAARVLWTI